MSSRLWRDVEIALDNELSLVHLPTEPVSVAEVARAAFGIEFTNELATPPARYDFARASPTLFGGDGPVHRDARPRSSPASRRSSRASGASRD